MKIYTQHEHEYTVIRNILRVTITVTVFHRYFLPSGRTEFLVPRACSVSSSQVSKHSMAGKGELKRALLRVIPTGFVVGAAIELFMIKVNIGNVNFYDTAKRKEMERRIELQQRGQTEESHYPDLWADRKVGERLPPRSKKE